MTSTDPLPMDIGLRDRNTSRGEFVYRFLRDAIKEGRLQQGTRVREEEIARLLNVSRTPVREALFRLQTRGLLELAPGRGLLVVEISRQQLIELYAMRELLEGGAARMAAQHASPSEIETLRYLMQEFQKAGDEPSQHAAINAQFHTTIYDAAHNRYLLTALNDLTDALALLKDTTFSVAERRADAIGEHAAIVEAIANHDPEAAERAAREHIRGAQQVRLAMFLESSVS